MDLLTHGSVGLIAMSIAPKAPVWALVTATAVPDLLLLGFQAVGIDHQAISQLSADPGLQNLIPPSRYLSHGLFMCIVWSVVVMAIAFLFSRDRRTSGVIGLLVLSHWVLDFVFYPNMPLLFGNSPTIGLGLISSQLGYIAGVILETGIIAGGVLTYFCRYRAINFPEGGI